MGIVACANQLRSNSNFISGLLYTAFQNGSDVQFLSDFAQVEFFSLKLKRGSAADYSQVPDRCKRINNFLGNPITGVTDPIRYTAILVTPEWFLAARTSTETGTNTVSARLEDIEMREYEMTHPEANMGIVIFGYLTGVPQTMESIWGLGPGKGSDKLKATLREAIAKARAAKSA